MRFLLEMKFLFPSGKRSQIVYRFEKQNVNALTRCELRRMRRGHLNAPDGGGRSRDHAISAGDDAVTTRLRANLARM